MKVYQDIHYWLRMNYGKATKCEGKNCSKNSNNFQWALKKGKQYEKVRRNFIQLCRVCHAKEDFTEKTRETLRKENIGKVMSAYTKSLLSKKMKGRPRPLEIRKRISESKKRYEAKMRLLRQSLTK